MEMIILINYPDGRATRLPLDIEAGETFTIGRGDATPDAEGNPSIIPNWILEEYSVNAGRKHGSFRCAEGCWYYQNLSKNQTLHSRNGVETWLAPEVEVIIEKGDWLLVPSHPTFEKKQLFYEIHCVGQQTYTMIKQSHVHTVSDLPIPALVIDTDGRGVSVWDGINYQPLQLDRCRTAIVDILKVFADKNKSPKELNALSGDELDCISYEEIMQEVRPEDGALDHTLMHHIRQPIYLLRKAIRTTLGDSKPFKDLVITDSGFGLLIRVWRRI